MFCTYVPNKTVTHTVERGTLSTYGNGTETKWKGRQGNYRRFRELTKQWVDLAIELCKVKLKESAEPDA